MKGRGKGRSSLDRTVPIPSSDFTRDWSSHVPTGEREREELLPSPRHPTFVEVCESSRREAPVLLTPGREHQGMQV